MLYLLSFLKSIRFNSIKNHSEDKTTSHFRHETRGQFYLENFSKKYKKYKKVQVLNLQLVHYCNKDSNELNALKKTFRTNLALLRPFLFYRIESRGQFHQPYVVKHKCTGSYSSAPVGAVQFHQQNYAQLHHYTQLENTLNFFAVPPIPCASKIGVNLLAQKLRVNCW